MVSTAFSTTLNCSAASGEMLAVGRASIGLSLPSSASSETELALELKELEARMAGG